MFIEIPIFIIDFIKKYVLKRMEKIAIISKILFQIHRLVA
jgi:hypothetical protein